MSTTTQTSTAPVEPSTRALTPIGVADVRLQGGFWGSRQELNTAVIIPHAAEWMTRLGWLDNLRTARDKHPYEHRGREFADSEIYKLLEAISWDVARGATDAADPMLEQLLTLIVNAQDPDGYLHTLFGRPWQKPRYSDFQWGHELYCFGHLIQSAVAHHRATGDGRMLDVARRLGDHVCTMFGPDGLNRVCGHAEIEVALAELSRVTGEARYLDQASVFVERRGTGTLPLFEFGAAYWQDDMPVRQATVLRGHAVRALYLAAGAVDVAVETGDEELLHALERQWDATIARRTYITGGMGSHHMDEAFGEDFVLPPDRSYCETCAGVASIMFSWRLLLATGKAKYADLIERTLYNIVATSPAADGRSFFYANTLHQRTEHVDPPLNEDGVVIRGGASGRQAWYEVSCCPPNVARTLASLGAYLATTDGDGVQIHQFATGLLTSPVATIAVSTEYPSDGAVGVHVEAAGGPFALRLRIPAWAAGASLTFRGVTQSVAPGEYALLEGVVEGENIRLDLPLEVRVILPDDRIDAIRGTVAVERGPEVFALESVDLPPGWELDTTAVVRPVRAGFIDGKVSIAVAPQLRGIDGAWPYSSAGTGVLGTDEPHDVALVPYHSWAERGPSTMRVWIPLAGAQSARDN